MGRKYGERTQTNIKHNKHSQENFEQFIPAPPPGKSRGVYTRPPPPPQENLPLPQENIGEFIPVPPPPENLGERVTAPLPQENLEECIPAPPPPTGESRGVYTRPSAPPCIQKLKNH